MKVRVGFGYDVHQLENGYELWLGGIKIQHSKGSVGHSDADALIHAICDALLGAANLRDIGSHFPNTSPDYLNIDSKILLKRVIEFITGKGYKIGNIDATVCIENPKLKPHISQMQETLAATMNTSIEDISIKAATNEKLGFVGKEEGVTAYAVALIETV